MKNKIFMIMAILVLPYLPLTAQAVEENFREGSLIIPMNSTYQGGDDASNDGGVMEAYGLVFALLDEGITIYWAINEDKADPGDVDFVIEDNTLDETEGEVVAKLYDHAGGLSDITFGSGDSYQRITYSGGPFIIDESEAADAKAIINDSFWAAVDVHEAQVPFAAPIY
ncbi:MAG: hypothetical protein JRJ29_22025, partial [Deltaproteobacteria bacterium]|nr:hypothetical protein [Deltaproteobacteria bacterium]